MWSGSFLPERGCAASRWAPSPTTTSSSVPAGHAHLHGARLRDRVEHPHHRLRGPWRQWHRGPWAARAQPGDEIALLGPGGGYAPKHAADWHLLVGDASALPAIAVALQRIPAERAAHVFIEVDSADEQQPLPSDADTHIHWVCRTSSELVDSVRAFEFPPGVPDTFVHGEAGAVRSLRRHLLVDRGLPKEALSASGYWKRGRTDEGWRADKSEWKRQVALEER